MTQQRPLRRSGGARRPADHRGLRGVDERGYFERHSPGHLAEVEHGVRGGRVADCDEMLELWQICASEAFEGECAVALIPDDERPSTGLAQPMVQIPRS